MTVYFFDTEATGSDATDQIIEAAYAKAHALPFDASNWFPDGYDPFNERFSPSVDIKLGAMAVHHITNDDLIGKDPSESFSLPADAEYLIGHNVDFDWRMAGQPDVKRICTLAISRYVLPDLDSHTQSALAYYFFGSKAKEMTKNAHSAIDDVRTLIRVFMKLLQFIETENTWEAIYQLSEQARIPKVMSFGKHKGELISELPVDYKRWIMRQDDFDSYVKIAVERTL